MNALAKSYVDSGRITPKKVGKALELFQLLEDNDDESLPFNTFTTMVLCTYVIVP